MFDLYITTGAGNHIIGGTDIWTNNFIENVFPKLKNDSLLLIDNKRFSDFNDESIHVPFHIHSDDEYKTDELLKKCDRIFFLHHHYHKRPHLIPYLDKVEGTFVHAYIPEIQVLDQIPEMSKLQVGTKLDFEWQSKILNSSNYIFWIGITNQQLHDDFDGVINIPNFYEFEHNLDLSDSISNGKVGYAARCESRKNPHYMNFVNGYMLTSSRDIENLKSVTDYKFKKSKIYEWNNDIKDKFFRKDWGIFHGAYLHEPFGYSIFEAVDYGKLPILHSTYINIPNYELIIKNLGEFVDLTYTLSQKDTKYLKSQFTIFKNFLHGFTNKEKWVSDILNYIN